MTRNDALTIDVADVALPEEALNATSVPNLLVCGPPMTDKFSLMLTLLTRISDTSMIVTTKHPSSHVTAAYRSVAGERGRRTIGVVDAVNGPEDPGGNGDDLVRNAGSPGDLTRIGTEFSDLLGSLTAQAGDERVGVGFHTLSSLTMHAGLQPVYRFLEALTARVRREDHRSVVVLDTPIAEYDVESLRHPFDAILETRTSDDGPELRVSGLDRTSSEWLPY